MAVVQNFQSVSYEEAEAYLISNIADKSTKSAVHNGVSATNELKLWNWFRTYSPPDDKGYMWYNHPNIRLMSKETAAEGHSGASFALTMRYLQQMSKEDIKFNNPESL